MIPGICRSSGRTSAGKRLRGIAPTVPGKAAIELEGYLPVVVKGEPARPAPESGAVLRVGEVRVELRELSPASAQWSARLLELLGVGP